MGVGCLYIIGHNPIQDFFLQFEQVYFINAQCLQIVHFIWRSVQGQLLHWLVVKI